MDVQDAGDRETRTSDHRRMAIQGFDSVAGSHYFHAFLEFQVDEVRKFLRQTRQTGEALSLFAFFLKAVGTTLGEEKLFNSMTDYSRTTIFGEVDIAIPIEISKDGRVENRQYVLRDVPSKSVSEITAEIDRSKKDNESQNGFTGSSRLEWLLGRLPRGLVRLIFKKGLRSHSFVKKMSGTTFVTSVSMFSNVPGHILPCIGGPKAASFSFGSITRKPVVLGDDIVIREVVSLTASFNHDSIDGAPAARFINRLRRLIEKDFATLI